MGKGAGVGVSWRVLVVVLVGLGSEVVLVGISDVVVGIATVSPEETADAVKAAAVRLAISFPITSPPLGGPKGEQDARLLVTINISNEMIILRLLISVVLRLSHGDRVAGTSLYMNCNIPPTIDNTTPTKHIQNPKPK